MSEETCSRDKKKHFEIYASVKSWKNPLISMANIFCNACLKIKDGKKKLLKKPKNES